MMMIKILSIFIISIRFFLLFQNLYYLFVCSNFVSNSNNFERNETKKKNRLRDNTAKFEKLLMGSKLLTLMPIDNGKI